MNNATATAATTCPKCERKIVKGHGLISLPDAELVDPSGHENVCRVCAAAIRDGRA